MSTIKATMYVGIGFDKGGKPVEVGSKLAWLDDVVARMAGGFTRSMTDGGWINAAQETIKEPGVRYEVICESKELARRIAVQAKEIFEQESVLLVVEPVESEFV